MVLRLLIGQAYQIIQVSPRYCVLSVCLFIHQFVYLAISLYVVYLSVCPDIFSNVWMSIHKSPPLYVVVYTTLFV